MVFHIIWELDKNWTTNNKTRDYNQMIWLGFMYIHSVRKVKERFPNNDVRRFTIYNHNLQLNLSI